MGRFAGIRNNRIFVVSSTPFVSETMLSVAIPDELESVLPIDIITKYRVSKGVLVPKHAAKPASELRVAFIGNWKMRCGISSYAEKLWPEVASFVGDFRLFVERNENVTGQLNVIGDQTIDPSRVISCWKRGESLTELVDALKEFDPDIIWVQHEWGLFPNARFWLSFLNQLVDFRVIVTMHSVFHHRDKTICEAAMPEIVVHLEGAKTVLKDEKRIASPVYVIPHGCALPEKERLWNFYKSDHTLVQHGFGFRYKGFSDTIKAVSILKKKYSDVFLTILFSESPFNKMQHQIYFNELSELIDELGLQENVAIIRGFQSEETIDSYLKTNKIAVFPYVSSPEHEVFGASGAARVAMTKGIPVISTSVNHFSDMPTIKADSPEQMAIETEKLFDDRKCYIAQVQKQNEFLSQNSWEQIAKMYLELFCSK